MRIAIVAVLACLGSTAFADAPGETAPVVPVVVDHKDPAIAIGLSIGTTLAGYGLLATGRSGTVTAGLVLTFVGPSTGQWYAHRTGWLGLTARAAGAYLLVAGIDLYDGGDDSCEGTAQLCEPILAARRSDRRRAEMYLYGGLALWVSSTIYDVVAAHQAASAWNREHDLAIAPTLIGPHQSPGVAITGRF